MIQQINGQTRLLGLLGNPVEHTLSPVIHNTLSALLEHNRVYVPFHVEAEGLEQAVRGAFDLNILGLNVTVPYKNLVMQYVVELDEAAKAIGAVNTLVRGEKGYIGYNTDMPGLLRAIQSEGIVLKGQTVVILGAGGASKAVAYMCMQEGASAVYLLNRTLEKAEAIADSLNHLFGRSVIEAMAVEDYDKLPAVERIVFQCTSLGLSPRVEEVVIGDREFYKHVRVGVDLIYNPAQTRFLTLVEEAGGQAYNGLKMLLYQGIIAYELWNGVPVTPEQAELVYDRLYEAVHPSGDNIVLIGFMGSGKTTIGRQIEKLYGYSFLDTDAYIEAREGRSISRIFEEEGEAYFRRLEAKVLQELIAGTSHALIATGGGMPLQQKNARLLRELGRVFYLETSEENIWNRVKNSHHRPLLENENPQQRIHELLEARQPLYQRAAHVSIRTDGRRVEELAGEINQIMKRG
ncbi:MAG: shikimate dehydrogenase [Bacteroides sp.]|nr:shikimate dehydrogenase [Bacteroides sp.]MCM1548586.1 shikimate dehydrogenase [Clostridium sp.]